MAIRPYDADDGRGDWGGGAVSRERILNGRVRRSSNRAPRFDYRSVGAYFVTVVTYQRQPVFGQVIDGRMVLNTAGRLAAREWLTTGQRRGNVRLDDFIVMPNHIHAIIHITTERPRPREGDESESALVRSPSHSVGAIIRGFKAATTAQLNRLAECPGRPLWQANYHDRILRTEREIVAAHRYIRANPANWPSDPHFAITTDDPRALL
ncbi:MAG: transposase [Dehalococcoidia bacterium]|nr:transposase [Dehalococcoidia bacterium]